MATDMNYDDMFFIHDDEVEEDTKKEEEQTSQRPPPANDTLVENIEKATDEHEDILRILVASDIHVGYGENKPNMYLDSVNTFEEVLKIATEKKVDMVLLGGDLFHENNPSRDMQHRVIQLLRQYCLNDKEVALEFVSDASVNFEHSRFDRVNYEDANINVGLPIFTIHGNHDDTAGKGLTILDVLHEAGLVNLFGKFSNIDQFDVSPILLRKGSTRVALFGIGSQRDDRLCRAFAGHTIRFLRPRAGYDDWFNILVLHQNRPRRSTLRSTGAYLPEQYIPTFFDLVLWGHEHECKPHCQYVASSDAMGDGFYILQPGSTIATSLTREEALQKNVFLIKIKGRKFQCKPIPLQTVRPMVVDEIVLDSLPEGVRLPANGMRPSGGGFVLDEMIIDDKISEMIRSAESNRGPQQPKLPLIRLKVTYAGPWGIMQPINTRQIGTKFADQVANATEMVVTRKVIEKKKKKGGAGLEEDQGEIIDAACLDQVISEHFKRQPWEERLTVFTHSVIGKALAAFDDDEKASTAKANQEFRSALEAARDKMMSKLKQMPAPELEFDKFGNLKTDDFEMMVRNDLSMLKRQTYGIQDGAVTRNGHIDDEMEDDA
ncbi:Double-strand break repair protein mre-11 [Trichostrongylus colubriformis]|uniref:Double-strand break repair protein n=1 Tax=Trichostrongylus colubriformis TaxID=6319 RepID=A0AAN8G9G4_TRICO